MSYDSALRMKARAALDSGVLPSRDPKRMWGGQSTGARCSICSRTIEKTEIEIELDFREDATSGSAPVCHLHPVCFAAWERERWRVSGTANPREDPAMRPAEHGGELERATSECPLPTVTLVGNMESRARDPRDKEGPT